MINLPSNLKGMIFPKSTINVYPSNHLHGAEASVSQVTDTMKLTSRYAAELFGFKNNIGLTIFDSPFSDASGNDRTQMDLTGRAKFDIYFQTDRWWDGSDYNLIPDYYANVWTAEGVSAFSGAVLGDAKASRYPNHGQELYDISGGVYGYDFVTDAMGSNNLAEINTLVQYHKDWLYNLVGRYVSGFSYRNGEKGARELLVKHFLGGRNSSATYTGDSVSSYGTSKIPPYTVLGNGAIPDARWRAINRNGSTRTWDGWKSYGLTESGSLAYSKGEVGEAISTNGWYNDFIHWHNCYDNVPSYNEFLDTFYSQINSEISTSFVNRMSYGDIVSYRFLRDSIDRVSAFEENGSLYIVAQVKDLYKGTTHEGLDQDIIYNLINVPISFELDLSGTGLTGLEITSNGAGIRKVSTDNFIVDANLSNYKEGVIAIKIDSTASPSYQDFDLPSIVSATESGGLLTITTDKESKLGLFWTTRGAEQKTSRILCRSNTLGASHIIDLNDSDVRNYYDGGSDPKTVTEILQGDIYIGVITEMKQSILSSAYQYA